MWGFLLSILCTGTAAGTDLIDRFKKLVNIKSMTKTQEQVCHCMVAFALSCCSAKSRACVLQMIRAKEYVMVCLALNDLSVNDAKAAWGEVQKALGTATKTSLEETLVCEARADMVLLMCNLIQHTMALQGRVLDGRLPLLQPPQPDTVLYHCFQ
jgi:hypothetical protein